MLAVAPGPTLGGWDLNPGFWGSQTSLLCYAFSS